MKLRKTGIVSQEEAERIGKLPPGKAHPVRKKIRMMNVGDILLVVRDEWDWQDKTPQVIVNDENRKSQKKFELSIAADDSGWFIERLE